MRVNTEFKLERKILNHSTSISAILRHENQIFILSYDSFMCEGFCVFFFFFEIHIFSRIE